MDGWLGGEKVKNKDQLSLAGTEVEAELGNKQQITNDRQEITKKKNGNEKQITNTSPKKQVTNNKLQIKRKTTQTKKKNKNNKYQISKNK